MYDAQILFFSLSQSALRLNHRVRFYEKFQIFYHKAMHALERDSPIPNADPL